MNSGNKILRCQNIFVGRRQLVLAILNVSGAVNHLVSSGQRQLTNWYDQSCNNCGSVHQTKSYACVSRLVLYCQLLELVAGNYSRDPASCHCTPMLHTLHRQCAHRHHREAGAGFPCQQPSIRTRSLAYAYQFSNKLKEMI
jgi:hypothetical protein